MQRFTLDTYADGVFQISAVEVDAAEDGRRTEIKTALVEGEVVADDPAWAAALLGFLRRAFEDDAGEPACCIARTSADSGQLFQTERCLARHRPPLVHGRGGRAAFAADAPALCAEGEALTRAYVAEIAAKRAPDHPKRCDAFNAYWAHVIDCEEACARVSFADAARAMAGGVGA